MLALIRRMESHHVFWTCPIQRLRQDGHGLSGGNRLQPGRAGEIHAFLIAERVTRRANPSKKCMGSAFRGRTMTGQGAPIRHETHGAGPIVRRGCPCQAGDGR